MKRMRKRQCNNRRENQNWLLNIWWWGKAMQLIMFADRSIYDIYE